MLFLSKGIDSWWVRVPLLGLFLALVLRPTTRRGALVAFLMWPLANLMTDVAKASIPFGRPGNEVPDAIIRVGMSQSMGTASAHSANMMFIGVALTLSFGWRGAPAILLALAVGLSRIYVAGHYPSQVLFGWTLGALAAFIAFHTVEAGVRVATANRERKSASAASESPSEAS